MKTNKATKPSNTSHTPGPWIIGNRGMVYTADLRKAIASCENLGHDEPGEADANARLIVAAPEMLEALISVRNEYRRYVLNDPKNLEDAVGSRVLAKIDAAIAKAEGREG